MFIPLAAKEEIKKCELKNATISFHMHTSHIQASLSFGCSRPESSSLHRQFLARSELGCVSSLRSCCLSLSSRSPVRTKYVLPSASMRIQNSFQPRTMQFVLIRSASC